MSYKNWKAINESMGINLGLGKPQTMGLMGTQFNEKGMTKKFMPFDVEEEDEEEVEGEDLDSEFEDGEGDEDMGPVFGDDEGGASDFPPEDPNAEMDGADPFAADPTGGAPMGDDGHGDDPFAAGDMGGDDMGGEGDDTMDQLNIDPKLLGPDFAGDDADADADMGDDLDPDADPDADAEDNSDIEAVGADDLDDQDMMGYMKHMSKAHKSYMRKNFMSANESTESFLSSLKSSAKSDAKVKWNSGFTGFKEDALIAPEPPALGDMKAAKPGEVGFAPQGRLGDADGNAFSGYQMTDFSDIPVLGESNRNLPARKAAKPVKKASTSHKTEHGVFEESWLDLAFNDADEVENKVVNESCDQDIFKSLSKFARRPPQARC